MKPKLAIITGASSGLGLAFAFELAKQGYNLLLTGRRKERLQKIKERLVDIYHIDVKLTISDFTDSADLNRLVQQISQLPSVHILINNAGMGCRRNFYDDPYQNQEKMLKIHITAASKLRHTVVPIMKRQRCGSIINVASLSAFMPASLSYFYSSSKAFLVSLSECMFMDLKPYNIHVQALCPGFVKTEFHQRQGIKEQIGWVEQQMLWMNKERVVKLSLKHLTSGQPICIPGFINQLLYRISSMIPRRLYYSISAYRTAMLRNDTLLLAK
nr:SDR family NAD(P)-dependent oxidoreductase [uncultured Carboxylicivirga sp.]